MRDLLSAVGRPRGLSKYEEEKALVLLIIWMEVGQIAPWGADTFADPRSGKNVLEPDSLRFID
jgi:hypothetical protein